MDEAKALSLGLICLLLFLGGMLTMMLINENTEPRTVIESAYEKCWVEIQEAHIVCEDANKMLFYHSVKDGELLKIRNWYK